jgi:multidrug resistance efflux pump
MPPESSAADQAKTQPAESPAPEKQPDPVRRTTLIVALLLLFLFVWYVFADRYAPWTDQARVQGFVVPIAPKVSGKVEQVNVVQDQIVEEGALLVQIDPRDYQLALDRARADLEEAGQEMGADTAAVATAQARLSEAKARQAEVEVQSRRVLTAYEKGALTAAQADQARAERAKAKARVASARAELDRAKQELGKQGQDNPRMRAAVAALEQARINLAETSIYAPSPGAITNLKIDEGHYANAGAPIMTFISGTDVWIQANLRENSIGHLQVGDPVEIALDVAPGRIFPGELASVGFGVDQPSGGEVGELATVQGDSGWLRDAQRFPVIVRFSDDSSVGLRRMGGQADVQIYTGDNMILNGLGWFWIRLMSWLSFVY